MPKLIVGFLLGVIVTLSTIQWLDQPDTPKVQQAVDQQLPTVNIGESSSSKSGANSDAMVRIPAKGNQQSVKATREPELRPAEAAPPVGESLAATASTSSLTVQRPNQTKPAADPGRSIANSNKYPPEIAEMIEKSVDKELQAQYENDEREDSWAPYMEGLLAAYFTQKAELAQFHISLIDCRTSICAVHAIGYGPNALAQWTVATADLVSQPWFEFNNMSMNRRNPVPDVLAIVLILTKNPSS